MTCLADKTNHPVKRLKSTAELLVGTLSACIQPEYWIQLPREQDVDLECRRSPKYVLMCRARPSVLHLQQGPPKVSFNCFQPAQVSFNWCIQPTQVSFICSITRPASSVLNCFRPAQVSLHSQRHLPHHTSPHHLTFSDTTFPYILSTPVVTYHHQSWAKYLIQEDFALIEQTEFPPGQFLFSSY